MVLTFYKGYSTYAIYAEETSFGAGGTPSSANNLGKVTSMTIVVANNQSLIQGLGDGANATNTILGAHDVTGTIELQVNNFDVFQYVVGERQGSGTLADPHELAERDVIGYSANQTPTLVFEVGSEAGGGGTVDDVWTLSGLFFNSITLNFNVNEIVTASIDFTAKTWLKSSSLTSITVDTKTPFVFQNISVLRDGTAYFGVSTFSVTVNANPFIHRALEDQNREIQQPARGIRRYEWSMTQKKALDSTKEDYDDSIDDLGGATDAPTQTAVPALVELTVHGDQGIGSGAEIFDLILENSTFDTLDEPIEVDDGITETTFAGFARSGDTDASDKVFIRYFTAA